MELLNFMSDKYELKELHGKIARTATVEHLNLLDSEKIITIFKKYEHENFVLIKINLLALLVCGRIWEIKDLNEAFLRIDDTPYIRTLHKIFRCFLYNKNLEFRRFSIKKFDQICLEKQTIISSILETVESFRLEPFIRSLFEIMDAKNDNNDCMLVNEMSSECFKAYISCDNKFKIFAGMSINYENEKFFHEKCKPFVNFAMEPAKPEESEYVVVNDTHDELVAELAAAKQKIKEYEEKFSVMKNILAKPIEQQEPSAIANDDTFTKQANVTFFKCTIPAPQTFAMEPIELSSQAPQLKVFGRGIAHATYADTSKPIASIPFANDRDEIDIMSKNIKPSTTVTDKEIWQPRGYHEVHFAME